MAIKFTAEFDASKCDGPVEYHSLPGGPELEGHELSVQEAAVVVLIDIAKSLRAIAADVGVMAVASDR